jgi:hypothetical protein
MEKRYGALRLIANMHQMAAFLVVILGIAAALFASAWGTAAAIPAAIVAVAVSGVVALFLWAVAESILVIIDIEENTRRAAETLSGLQVAPPSPPAGDPPVRPWAQGGQPD